MKSEYCWDKMSPHYDQQVQKYQQTYADTVERTKIYLKQEHIILDFACGTGMTTLEIAANVREKQAIDISAKMITLAREKADRFNINNIRFLQLDLFSETFKEDSFDVILAFNVLYLLEDAAASISRIHQLLKPGGLFISTTDCLGEQVTFSNQIKHFLSRIGILPFMHLYSIADLENLIAGEKFSLIETSNLSEKTPNYFIAAKKNA